MSQYISCVLQFFLRYLANNFDWLHEQLDEHEDDFFLFDCPGKFKNSCIQ